MRSTGTILLALLAILGISAPSLHATLNADYQFSATTNSYTPISGGTMAINGSNVSTPGNVGSRRATLWFVTDRGDTVSAQLTGEAGTRTMSVNPAALNFGNLSSGSEARQMITITNTGTMPLRLQTPVLGGTNPGDYTLGALPRLDLVPGQMEFLEVTFRPTANGPSSATVTIGSDASGGSVVVQLGGTAVKSKFVGGDPTGTSSPRGNDVFLPGIDNPHGRVSSTETETSHRGYSLHQSIPNPARDEATVNYSLVQGGSVVLDLYDAAGGLVRLLEKGDRSGGLYEVHVDLRGLPAGLYHVRMEVGGVSLSRPLTVVR